MNDVSKVLVVDDGERSPDRALSVELAGLGYASVTTSIEAAEDVLAVIATPAAILLQMPQGHGDLRRQAFVDLAERLKANGAIAGIPVVMVEPRPQPQSGAYSVMQDGFGAHALAKPDRS